MKNKMEELQTKSAQDLNQLAAEKREELRDLRFQLAAGKVKNVRSLRETKKQIARILTAQREKANQ